jgi:hypothetical protein
VNANEYEQRIQLLQAENRRHYQETERLISQRDAEIAGLREEVARVRDAAVTEVHRSWAAERVEWQAQLLACEQRVGNYHEAVCDLLIEYDDALFAAIRQGDADESVGDSPAITRLKALAIANAEPDDYASTLAPIEAREGKSEGMAEAGGGR